MKFSHLGRLTTVIVICMSPVLASAREPDDFSTGTPIVHADDLVSLAKFFTLSTNAPGETTYAPQNFSPEFAFGIGYSKLKLVNTNSPFTDEDTLRLDPRISFSPIPGFSPLRLGFGLGMDFGGSGLSSGAVIVNDGQIIIIGTGQDQSLTVFEPEVELSLRFGNMRFYVEPGISGGGAFGYYRIGNYYYYYSDTVYDSWGETAYGRAFVRVGFGVPGGYFGIDAAYLRGGKMSFSDNISGDLEEFSIGIYGAFAF